MMSLQGIDFELAFDEQVMPMMDFEFEERLHRKSNPPSILTTRETHLAMPISSSTSSDSPLASQTLSSGGVSWFARA